MSRPCTVCVRPNATEINATLRLGKSLRVVARLFGLSKSTVQRHAGHLPEPDYVEIDPAVLEEDRASGMICTTNSRGFVRWNPNPERTRSVPAPVAEWDYLRGCPMRG